MKGMIDLVNFPTKNGEDLVGFWSRGFGLVVVLVIL